MSIDNTVNELSNTLSELGRLVNHINSQISGITGRINKTLDNFDDSVAKVAGDASSVTGQLTDTVSQVPNSWVFYLLLITLCIVFILLSIVLSLNLVTKMHAIWVIFKGRDTEKIPFLDEEEQIQQTIQTKSGYGLDPRRPTRLEPRLEPRLDPRFDHSSQNDTTGYQAKRAHVAVSMESEPRRFGAAGNANAAPGAHETFPRAQVTSENGFNDTVQAPVAVQRRIGSGNEQAGQLGPPSSRQGIYHLDSGTTSYTTRSLKSQEV